MGKVHVVGSINMDVVAFSPTLPKPGETISGTKLSFFPGGKGANQAVAAARAGAETSMHGAVGDDGFGATLTDFLSSAGVDVSNVEHLPNATSGTAVIFVDDNGENCIVVVPGANAYVRPLLSVKRGDVVVCQFEVPLTVVDHTLRAAKAALATTVLNPAPVASFSALDVPDYLIVNEHEARELRVIGAAVGQTIIVTHGKNGATATGKHDYSVAGREVQPVDSTGAGDCFVGSLAARLALGDSLSSAMDYANAAAAISVTRPGAGPSMPSMREVLASL